PPCRDCLGVRVALMADDLPLTVAGAAAALCAETHAPRSHLIPCGNHRVRSLRSDQRRSSTRDGTSRIKIAGCGFWNTTSALWRDGRNKTTGLRGCAKARRNYGNRHCDRCSCEMLVPMVPNVVTIWFDDVSRKNLSGLLAHCCSRLEV